MKTETEIREMMSRKNPKGWGEALAWVLENTDCPMCNRADRRELEIRVHRGDSTAAYIEQKYQWPMGTVMNHMDMHVEYDPTEAAYLEEARSETINTLNVTEGIVQRVVSWIEELEQRKDDEGMTDEVIGSFTKLVAQAQGVLKLAGQLKREIGLDNQLLLAERRDEMLMGVLVEVLRNEPVYLDQIQLRLAALAPPTYVQDTDFEVVD